MANPTPSHGHHFSARPISDFRREDDLHINASPNSASLDDDGLFGRMLRARFEIPCINASPNSAAPDEDRSPRRIRGRWRRITRVNASPNSASLDDDGLFGRMLRARFPDSGRFEIPCINASPNSAAPDEDIQGPWRPVRHINASPNSADEGVFIRFPVPGRFEIPLINASPNSAAPDEDIQGASPNSAAPDEDIQGPWRRVRHINASPNSAALDEAVFVRRIRARFPVPGRFEIPFINASPNSAAPDEETATTVNGLSEEVISRFTKTTVYEAAAAADPGLCVVCQDNYRENQRVGVLHCRHFFHAECIGKWLQIKNVCPLCNAVV